jgi:DNA-binding CsgD family transcriptional regulator
MPVDRTAELLGVVQDIYAASLDPVHWETVLAKVARLVRAEAGSVWIHDFANSSASFDGTGDDVAAFSGFDPSEVMRYADHYSAVNVWTANEDKYVSGSVVTSSVLYPDAMLKRTEFFGDWLQPQDLFYALGSIVEKEGTRAVKMSFLRPERAGAYNDDEMMVMRLLMPHLRTAVQIHRRMYRMKSLSDSALDALNAVGTGVVLVSARGTMMHANSTAHTIAMRTGALRFGARGELDCGPGARGTRLQEAIARAVHCSAGALEQGSTMLRVPHAHGEVALLVTPVSGMQLPFVDGVCAIVFCSDPQVVVARLNARLVEIYGMTPAEARLVEALAMGKTLKDFSEERSIAVATARTQLASAGTKVGAKRQADIVRIVLTGPAVLKLRSRASE